VDGRGSTRVSIYNTPICFFFTKKSKFVFGKKSSRIDIHDDEEADEAAAELKA